jgi:adenylate cyclase
VGGRSTEPVTVLFSDVRGFTKLSATLKSQRVAQMLNDRFHEFVPIIRHHNGSVDKYIGDAIMAVFGCPRRDDDQLANAVRAAWHMQVAWRTALLPRWTWLTEADKAQIGIGIGIHTGEVWHGFVGAEEYIDYTVVGEVVNAASRYCDGTQRGEIVISPEVYKPLFAQVEAHAMTVPTKHEGEWRAHVVTGLR